MNRLHFNRIIRISAFLSILLLTNIARVSAQSQGLAERVRALNNTLLQLHSRAQDAPGSAIAEIRSQAASVIQDRSAALEALIRQSPKDALALAFSEDTL